MPILTTHYIQSQQNSLGPAKEANRLRVCSSSKETKWDNEEKKILGCFPQNIYGNHGVNLLKIKAKEYCYEVKGIRMRKRKMTISKGKAFH